MNFLGTALNYGLGGLSARGRWSAVVVCRALFREGDANRVLRGSLLLAVGASARYFIANGDIYMKSFHKAFQKLETAHFENCRLRLKKIYVLKVLEFLDATNPDFDTELAHSKIIDRAKGLEIDNQNIQLAIDALERKVVIKNSKGYFSKKGK